MIAYSIMAVKLKRRLLSVEDYHLMGKVGILNEKGIELINGEIIEMSPIGSKHAAIVEKIKDLLVIFLHKKAIVRVQNPIFTNKFSEPEPDLAIVKFRTDYYIDHHPKPEETFLVIEIADSSLEYDREVKLPIYALAGIPEFWIINLKDKQIEIYTVPSDNIYKEKKLATLEDVVIANSIDFSLAVRDVLG